MSVELKGKTYRNTQEQVLENAQNIEKLKTGELLDDDSIDTNNIKDSSITTEKINNGAITTEKINDGAINYDKLASALKYLIDGKADKTNIPFENIKDLSGNNRFIQGVPINQDEISGLHYTYSKWSLSGSHLMLVVAGYTEAGTIISAGLVTLGEFTLPEWVLNKIQPTISPYIDFKKVSFTTNGYNESQNTGAFIYKSNKVVMQMFNWTPSATDNEMFSCQFDLIIDN